MDRFDTYGSSAFDARLSAAFAQKAMRATSVGIVVNAQISIAQRRRAEPQKFIAS